MLYWSLFSYFYRVPQRSTLLADYWVENFFHKVSFALLYRL